MSRNKLAIPFESEGSFRPPDMENLLKPSEVAQILRVSVAWVYDHAERKQPLLPCVRLGKAVRFRREDLQKFIEEMIRRAA